MVAVLAAAISLLACITTGAYALAPPVIFDFPIGVQNQSEWEVNNRVSFLYKYVTHAGKVYNFRPSKPYILVARTNSVSELAQQKATEIVRLMVKHMPTEVFIPLSRSQGVGLFSASEGVTIYPENKQLADRPDCYGRCNGHCAITCTFDGRKWSRVAGLTNSRAVCLDDIVLCNKRDPYGNMENILSHEFAHLIMRYMPSKWSNKISRAYRLAKSRRTWRLGTYAMATEWEYWAEASEAFFLNVLRTDVTGGMNMCGTRYVCPTEMAARRYLQQHDPDVFEVLSYIYTNNNPSLPGNLRACQ